MLKKRSLREKDSNSPIIRKGAARFIPINSMPRYMASPKAAAVDMQALMLPNSPSKGLERTVSRIMHVMTLRKETTNWDKLIVIAGDRWLYLNIAIKTKVEPKYGTTVRVFFSNSWSSVRDANLAIEICLKYPPSSYSPTVSRNLSSQAAPLWNKTNEDWRPHEFDIDLGLLGILALRVSCHKVHEVKRWHAYDVRCVVCDFRATEKYGKCVRCGIKLVSSCSSR